MKPVSAERGRVEVSVTTSRPLWIAAFVLTAVAVLFRIPTMRGYVAERLTAASAEAGLTDRGLEALAVNTGILLALGVSLILLAMYYSLAAALERTIFSSTLTAPFGQRAGLYFVITCLVSVPVQAFAAAFDIASPKSEPAYLACAAAVGLLTPLLFRAALRALPVRRRLVVHASALVLAALSVVT